MDLTVLAIAGCPGAALLEERLAVAAAGLAGIRVSRQVIGSEAEADAAGMRGSPTLLVAGADPFAAPDGQAGLSCRLYRQDNGSLAPAPPVGELRRALSEAGPPSPTARRLRSLVLHHQRPLDADFLSVATNRGILLSVTTTFMSDS